MISPTTTNAPRRKAVWGPKRTLVVLAFALLALPLNAGAAAKPKHFRQTQKVGAGLPNSHAQNESNKKLDDSLRKHAKSTNPKETVDLIVMLDRGQELPFRYKNYVRGKKLDIINSYALENVPVRLLALLEQEFSVHRAHYDRAAMSMDFLSSTAVKADILASQFGYTGAGVGVAFIDSGFTAYPQPDLKDNRVTKFVDFVNRGNTLRVDLNGHGTHVTGIVGGTGKIDSKQAGIAPGASIVSLRVLDEQGKGRIGDIIAAMDWVSKNYIKYNIRIVNMSVGAGVYESYWTDPLTLAAKALVDQGITVVAAAGNFGKNRDGELQFGGITSPGVAPWVLTACASSTMGTPDLSDDVVANFSSAGPTYIDFTAKPDVCAPGVGVVSLAAPESALFSLGGQQTPSWLVDPGNHPNYPYAPYLSLSGTSQATPVVTGTVALMLQANPNLTPNLIKAILQYTASFKADVNPLRQGGGFMNALGAVELAKFFANAEPGSELPMDPSWSKHIIWGNHMLSGGVLDPGANAWMPGVEWGWAYTQGDDGDNIVWGTDCSDECDNIVWGTDDDGDNIVWGTADDEDNIVWGTADDEDNIVWGTADDEDNIVWGTADDEDNIVWGTADDEDNIVWGTEDDGDNIVWGTGDDDDNIVWGTDCGGDDCDNVVWGTEDDDNIVWGTADDDDNIVWGTGDDEDNIVWGTGDDEDNIVWGTGTVDENIVWGAAEDEVVTEAAGSQDAWATTAKENVDWTVYRRKGGK